MTAEGSNVFLDLRMPLSRLMAFNHVREKKAAL